MVKTRNAGAGETETGANESREPVPDGLTVDQLARLTGTTTRNVRAFQTMGLLPRPVLRGRTGLYGDEHRHRLRAILRLQGAGFSLAALATLFAAWDQGLTLAQVLGIPASAPAPAPAGAVGDRRSPDDALDAFDDWPGGRRRPGLAVVPTTVLDQMAS
ncbi:MAG: MerR family transcriptional regulator [Acidimicrobiales bacterium]